MTTKVKQIARRSSAKTSVNVKKQNWMNRIWGL